MDLDQLAALDHVVREGSFTRAAVALGIGQPAVSARIQALEDEVGGALFTRGRRVALTALGDAFLPFARRALEVLGEGLQTARLAQVGQRGRIRLASLGSLAGGLVGPAVSAFARAHPEVEWFIRSGDHEQVVGLLADGVVDLGVAIWPCTEAAAADLQAVLAFREPVVLAVRPGHALAGTHGVTQEDIARLGRPVFRQRWWQKHHPALLRVAERAGLAAEIPKETARRMAIEGLGVGFFARTYIAEDLERGALVEVEVQDLPRIYRDCALVRRRRAPLSPATAGLVEAIRRRAGSLGILAAGRRPSAGRR